MRVDWIELNQFRIYEELRFTPDPGINVLVGSNAAGKTTVLEAIAYSSALRSFRKSPDQALVRTGASVALVRTGFAKASGETRVEIELPAVGRRRVLLNGKRPTRHSDVAATVPVVAFLPDDLDLVKDSAGTRRRYLDDLGSQLAPGYGAALSDYEQTLRQRNALLRRDGPNVDALSLQVWDDRLIKAAVSLWAERAALVERLSPVLAGAHQSVAAASEPLHVALTPGWGDAPVMRWVGAAGAADTLSSALQQRRRREMEQRTTTVGPHRDDPTLHLGRRDTRTQASQGEQRSVAVALRVAAYRLLQDRHGHPPVLLLDDVFSELDLVRTAAVVEMLPAGQVFITTTRDDEIPVAGHRWDVGNGTLR